MLGIVTMLIGCEANPAVFIDDFRDPEKWTTTLNDYNEGDETGRQNSGSAGIAGGVLTLSASCQGWSPCPIADARRSLSTVVVEEPYELHLDLNVMTSAEGFFNIDFCLGEVCAATDRTEGPIGLAYSVQAPVIIRSDGALQSADVADLALYVTENLENEAYLHLQAATRYDLSSSSQLTLSRIEIIPSQ